MKTSYFGNKNLKSVNAPGIAICRKVPDWFNGWIYKELAPKWEMIRALKEGDITEEEFTQRYKNEILSNLDPLRVFNALGHNAILLCWEAPDKFCHRQLVARWIEEEMGKKVPELETPAEKDYADLPGQIRIF